MSMVRCNADEHFYDDAKHTFCPYCSSVEMDEETRIISSDDKTKVIKQEPKQNDSPKTQFAWGSQNTQQEESFSPVVGWLVVLNGDGKGKDYKLIPGMNTIGRDGTNGICITSDATITSSKHAIVVYDYKNNKYFLTHGEGTNLTYLNDNVVLQPSELTSGDKITLGNTDMKFMPFEYDWNL
jgi:hypothetical protein